MSERHELTVSVEGEDNISPVLRQIMSNLDRLTAKMRKVGADIAPKAVQTFKDQRAKQEEQANRAIRDWLGLREQAAKQRTAADRDDARARRLFESDSLRAFRLRMRHHTAETKAMATANRARDRAIAESERQAQRFARAAESDAVRRFRFQAAMTRQRFAEQRAGERDRQRAEGQARRDAEADLRRRQSGDRWRFQLRERMDRRDRAERERDRKETIGRGRDALERSRDGYRGLTRSTGGAALAGMGATGLAVRRALVAENDIDQAEVNVRAFGGLSKDAARELRDRWAAPLAEALGTGADKLLKSYVDALKIGIPNEGAKLFSELATKTSEAWSVPFEGFVDILGTVNSILTSKGDAFNFEKLKSVSNTIQHLAAKQSTTPEKLMSFLQRGAGAADVLGMSQEAGLAFGSASTSLGNQAGQSGRMFDYLASRLIEMPRLTKRKGEEGDQARDLVKALGYGSADAMEARRRADPDEFLPDFMNRFNKISDPKKQDQALRFFTGREWLGEFGRMVKGIETYKEAQKLAKEAKGLDAISNVWDLHRLKLAFVFKQFKAGWLNILGEFGKVLSPLARQAGDFFLSWTQKLRAGGLKDRFKAALDGLLEGLGVMDLPDLLKRMFGDPKTADGGAIENWKAAARGFGSGIRSVVDTITGAAKVFTGGSLDPEKLGRLTAKVLGFGLALLVISPFVGVLASIATGLLGLALAAGTAWRVMKALGIVGGTAAAGGAGAGAAAGGAGAGILGKLSRFLRLGGLAAGPALTLSPSQGDREAMMKRLGAWARKRNGQAEDTAPDTTEPDPLQDALRSIDPSLAARLFPNGATVEKQSFGGTEDWRDLIRPAVADGGDGLRDRRWYAAGRILGDGFLDRVKGAVGKSGGRQDGAASDDHLERISRTLTSLDKRAGLPGANASLPSTVAAALGVPGASSGGSGLGIGVPGDPAKQFGRKFFTPPGMQVPGWYGGGSGVTPPLLKGEAVANARKAFDFFTAKGLSPEAASGILASMKQESRFNPRARGDGGRAHGLFQHHPDRRAAILHATGIDMSTASYERQLEGAWWEMNHGDRGAQRALGILRRPGISAREAGAAFVQHFERPARDERASRGASAEGFAREMTGKAHSAGSDVPTIGGAYPLDQLGKVTSAFGMRRHPLTGILMHHNGIDLAAPAGTAVRAMKEGIASLDRSGDVSVKHDDGSSTTYRHITAAVQAGARVGAGQVIGRLRAHDPRSTGPHLHFEARDREGRLYDPKALLGPSDALMAKAKQGEWQAGAGGNAQAIAGKAPAAATGGERMIQNIPLPPQRPSGMGSGSGGGGQAQAGNVNIVQHISGAGKNPQELANDVQRHITEAWNNRAHDLDLALS